MAVPASRESPQFWLSRSGSSTAIEPGEAMVASAAFAHFAS